MAGVDDGVELRAGDPQRRVRLLRRLGHHVAQRELEVVAVPLPTFVPEHRQRGLHRLLPHHALVAEAAIEGMELGDRGALAQAELDAAVRHQVERRHPLGDARRVVGGELDDAVAEADLLGALARRGEEDLGRRRMRVLLEEVVLDLPGVVVPEPVGELDLIERVLDQRALGVRGPRARELMLVEDAELHAGRPPRESRSLPRRGAACLRPCGQQLYTLATATPCKPRGA